MNNNSYESLCKILMNCNIKDAIELDEYITEWDIKNDKSIIEMINRMKGMYINDTGKYYRNRLFKYDKYEIVLIYWCPYSYSRVHYHPNGGCIMKILEGYLDIDIYDDSDYSTIQNIASKMRTEGNIEYMRGKHGIHRISNENNGEYAISIHIYVYNK
jgi:hypothetical protein